MMKEAARGADTLAMRVLTVFVSKLIVVVMSLAVVFRVSALEYFYR